MNSTKKTKNKRSKRTFRLFIITVALLAVGLGGYKLVGYIFNRSLDKRDRTILLQLIPKPSENSFEGAAYFIESNSNRYENYAKKNSSLHAREVVWRVNAKLDYPFYTNIEQVDTKDEIIIVNKYRQLPSTYEPELVQIQNGLLATAETTEAYHKMRNDMIKQNPNYDLQAISAYRSYELQSRLYNNYVSGYGKEDADTFSARPGHSEHQLGTAIDVSDGAGYTSFGETAEYSWIKSNAYKYGFINSYQEDNTHITGYIYEPWHIRYVGVEIATEMHEKGIKYLEEYVIKYIEKDKYK